MNANLVTREAGHRIRGAKLRESFVASPITHAACEDLQRQFEAIARPGEVVPDVHANLDFMNRLAARKFAEYLVADRGTRAAKNLYAYLAEERDDAAAQLAAVLAPAKRASDELLPENVLKVWLHGPLERTPASLHRQAEEVSFWIHEARDELGEPVLQGLRFEPDELVAEIERYTENLGGTLGSLDEAAGLLDVTRHRARQAGEACDQTYLQVKATLEAVCRLGGQGMAVGKYGPPSLRKLQRGQKRKKRRVAAEQVLEDALTERDAVPATSAVLAQESDRQPGAHPPGVEQSDLESTARPAGVKESDLESATRSAGVKESDLEVGTRSTGVCRDFSAVTDGSRRKRRRGLAVTSGGGGHGGRLLAVTGGVRSPRRGRLSVTRSVCGARGSRSEVTDTVRSPENRGTPIREGVTARIRRFFARPLER